MWRHIVLFSNSLWLCVDLEESILSLMTSAHRLKSQDGFVITFLLSYSLVWSNNTKIRFLVITLCLIGCAKVYFFDSESWPVAVEI